MDSEATGKGMSQVLCRICGHPLQHPLVRLADMPLTDDFVPSNEPERTEYTGDILIYECRQCGIVQNPSDFNFGRYYRDYQYSSGHSAFTRQFMQGYASVAIEAFKQVNAGLPKRVLEAGSGDGAQLQCFLDQGLTEVLGIEPSEVLAAQANASGLATRIALFDQALLAQDLGQYDICLSSYTFDHVRNPAEYLHVAHTLLNDGGILAIEVHDLDKIVERAEYCLFEHEHTIYLGADDIHWLLERAGFSVVATNPLPASQVRGNSLLVLAAKAKPPREALPTRTSGNPGLGRLGKHISNLTQRIDRWIDALPPDDELVGFGAGGRGIMTLAGLQRHTRFKALFDSNFQSNTYLAPKTRIPVVGPPMWASYKDAHCLVFSFGYLTEIKPALVAAGFAPEKIVSLLDFYTA